MKWDRLERRETGSGDAPPHSRSLLDDLRLYLLHRPRVSTRVAIDSAETRRDFEARIMRRIGIRVDSYTVLNIHRIGVEVPVSHVFDELLKWGADAEFWPNHLATVERHEESLDHMRVLLLGRSELPFGLGDRLFGLQIVPLFRLHALRIQRTPVVGQDNARYLLYESGGGYPIGFLALYVRSRIPAQGERAMSQLFFVVGFDFYGRKDWARARPLRRLWEIVHDRVTANVLNRFKRICEASFETLRRGDTGAAAPPLRASRGPFRRA